MGILRAGSFILPHIMDMYHIMFMESKDNHSRFCLPCPANANRSALMWERGLVLACSDSVLCWRRAVPGADTHWCPHRD
jgi:hypothetical protein